MYRYIPKVSPGATLALACLAVSLAANAEGPLCRADPATGLPLPELSPGICAAVTGSGLSLVQLGPDGLLVVSPDLEPPDLGTVSSDGTSFFHAHDRGARLIYCPRALLDGDTGAPGVECLLDAPTLTPGAGAFVGTGRVKASVVVDATGAAQCPSAVHVIGAVEGPEAGTADLRASLSLSPTGLPARSPGTGWLACAASPGEIRISRRSPFGEAIDADLRRIAAMDPSDWDLVAGLLKLSDDDRSLLKQILSLEPAQLASLETRLRRDGAAMITDGGVVLPAGANTPGRVVSAAALEGILHTILARVNEIRTKVNDIRSQVNDTLVPRVTDIRNRIPDAPEIRSLIDPFLAVPGDPAVPNRVSIDDVREGLDRVGEQLRGVLDIADELRQGFDDWGDCGVSTTECGQFKEQLTGDESLLADLREAAELAQSVACLQRPGLRIRPLETGLLEALIDKSPSVVLLALSNVLNRVAPEDPDGTGGWRDLLGEILDLVPAETRDGLADFCADGESAAPASAQAAAASAGVVCRFLRPAEIGQRLVAVKVVADKNEEIAKFLEKFQKDELSPALGAVAVGGATIGVSVKNVAKSLTELLGEIPEGLADGMEKLIDKRDECLEADGNIEADLRGCSPPVSVFLRNTTAGPATPDYNDVLHVVNLRIREVRDCQRGPTSACDDLRLDAAIAHRNEARAPGNRRTRSGYESLCCAYDALTAGNRMGC